jgi:S1-C subfamily serine protease
MGFHASCPGCGESIRPDEKLAGRQVRCAKCGEVFRVPAIAKVPEESEQVSSKPIRPSAPAETAGPGEILDVLPVESDAKSVRRKQSTQKQTSRIPVLLLVAGGAALLLLVGIGVAAWMYLQGSTRDSKQILGDATPAKGLDELKAATAFVKVSAGPVRTTGSGFLIRVVEDTGYVVTNAHVVDPRDGPRAAPGAAGPAGPPPEITLVFHSGTKQERSYRGQLVAQDTERDLAVLKITGAANLPRPLDITGAPELVETLPVTVFGFPFGEALGLHEGNPAITVSKGSVSSIRRDKRDRIVGVQIDGALNPGNSGGPVVDSEGRLVGVAAATIRGAHIGLAIPGSELSRMLEGSVGNVRATVSSVAGANAVVQVEVALVDPLGHVQSVTLHYARSDLVRETPQENKDGEWPELPEAQRVALRLDGRRALGSFVILATDASKAFTFQATFVNDAGRTVHAPPVAVRMSTPATPVAVSPKPRPVSPGRPPVRERPKPVNPLPLAAAKPIKRPQPTAYQVHLPATDMEQAPLVGPVADMAMGGAGRYLVLRLANKKKLAVFDVQQGKVAKELSLQEETPHVAAGANRLIAIYPNAKQIQKWKLPGFEPEPLAPLPDALSSDTIHQVCMGSASAGPLFIYLHPQKQTLALNMDAMEASDVRWSHWGPTNAPGPMNMRPAPDGSLLAGWGGGWAGCGIATFSDGVQTGSHEDVPFWAADGAFASPSADARFIFTPGRVVNRGFSFPEVPEMQRATVVPATEPGFYVSLAGTCVLGSSPKFQAAGEVAVHADDRTRLFTLKGLDELKVKSDLPWDKRIFYYPCAGLLITLGGEKDKLLLRRIDLPGQLEKSGTDYLAVVSRPPVGKAGAKFSYRLDIRSAKGGIQAKLASGPEGLKVDQGGQVSWDVPAAFTEPEAEVLVTIRDAAGHELNHTFVIPIARPQ